jgi:hypothetical protein
LPVDAFLNSREGGEVADFVISVSNSVNTFGPAPSTKWGTNTPYTMTWGTSKWGEGTEDLIVQIVKNLTAETLTLTDALYKNPNKLLENSADFTSETTAEALLSGNGYYYVFVAPTTDGEDRNLSTYTSGSAGSVTYTSVSVASTTWS